MRAQMTQIKSSSALYRSVWRWHFYAGVFCLPFVMLLSITGAMYLFKPQIDQWAEREYQSIVVSSSRSTPAQQVQVALDAIDNAKFISYRLPAKQSQAVAITLTTPQERVLAYINPYTLEVLKVTAYESQPSRIIRALHGELMLGNVGSILVELAGCWAIVLTFTGVYLWWPRNRRGLAGIVYPRLRSGARYFWRDLHAVTGLWAAFFTLFLLISGLPWTLVWGSAFKEIRSITANKPVIEQSWQLSNSINSTASTGMASSQPQTDLAPLTSTSFLTTLTPALMTNIKHHDLAPPIEISQDKKHKHHWKASSKNQNRMLRQDIWFDMQTGKVIRTKAFKDRSTLDKIIGIGISAHEGHLFGWANQLLGVVITLGLIIMCVSSFILWQKRKPSNTLGAPPQLNPKKDQVVLGLTIALALVLPALAVSLALIWLAERYIFRRIAVLNTWLGLPEK